MEFCLLFTVVVLVTTGVGALLYFFLLQAQKWKDALRTVGGELGLTFDEGGFLQKAKAEGVTGDGLYVILDSYTVSTGKSSTTYTRVRVKTPETGDLQLSAEGMSSAFGKLFVGDDLHADDKAFDDQVVVRASDPADAISRLDGPARNAVVEGVFRGASLSNGEWTLQKHGLVTDVDRLRTLVDATLNAARAVRHADTRLAERLVRNTREERNAAVRARNLEFLIERFEPQRDLLAECLADPSPRVRLVAARALGPQGFDALRRLLEVDSTVGLGAALALCALASDPRFAAARAAVQEALLRSVAASEPDVAAIRALGRIGTVDAVEPLLAHTEGVWPGELKRTARDAIAAIQSRLQHADAGQLSLVDEVAGGELSLAGQSHPAAESETGSEDEAEARRRRAAARRQREG